MRDNLVFSGITESAEEDPEVTVKTFIIRPSDGSEETWSPEAASYCGQIWILQAERAGEESRQGAERNRLQRKRPVPQRNPGATQNFVPNPTQSHPKGLPSCHRRGPALRGRAALPQPQFHSVVILTPLQIIRYIFLFFLSFLACSSIYL